MSQIGTTYSNSHGSGASYSAGMWQATNAVFPSIPGGSLPGDRVPMPSAPTGTVPAKKASFKLRRSILPKQPLTILCELASGAKPVFEFYDVPFEERERRAWQMECGLEDVGCYECRCSVQGMEFIGEGATKTDAKDNVIDIAIQGLVGARCELNDDESGVGNSEDNTPWPQLASLALYKLFTDWQSQGYSIPRELTELSVSHAGGYHERPGGGVMGGSVQESSKPALQILNEMASRMRTTVDYECISEIGPPNDKVFCFQLRIGDKCFKGQAKNKKAAKQAAAQAAVSAKDSWYSPAVNNPPPPGEADHEEDHQSPYASQPPPSKKKHNMSSEMKRMYFGDDQREESKSRDPKIVFREPSDRGTQPGSYQGPKK